VPLVELNGVRLLVEETGRGEPLVLVHGSWDDRQTWAFVEGDLATSFTVVSYDRRGHTGSDDSAEPGSRRDDEDDLAALIDAHGLAPAHVAANSFGASVALGLASRRPELVRSLCGHEPPLFAVAGDDPTTGQFDTRDVLSLVEAGEWEAAARRFADDVVGPGTWERMSRDARATMAANAGTFLDEGRDPDWASIDLDALAALEIPVLLTLGDRSRPYFAPVVDRLMGAMRHTEVRTILGAGHMPHLTHPAEWTQLVNDFARGAA
jgi:pimeloyl-ACP methyl ester carboxylesterase